MRKSYAALFGCGLLMLTVVMPADARTITIDIQRTDVQSHAPTNPEFGDYYVFNLAIPAKHATETFMGALMELYVDAASDIENAATGGIVTFEVFPLKTAPAGELNASQLRSAAMKKTVQVGESRRVRIPIGEHVRYLLEHPEDNFGLAMGSLSGQRLGKFTLRHDILGTGVVARITITYDELPVSAASAP